MLAPRNAARLTHIKRNAALERLLQKAIRPRKYDENFNHAAVLADAPGPARTRRIDRAPVPHRGGRVNCRASMLQEQRQRGVLQQMARGAAQHPLAEAVVAVGAHDQQVGAGISGRARQ